MGKLLFRLRYIDASYLHMFFCAYTIRYSLENLNIMNEVSGRVVERINQENLWIKITQILYPREIESEIEFFAIYS